MNVKEAARFVNMHKCQWGEELEGHKSSVRPLMTATGFERGIRGADFFEVNKLPISFSSFSLRTGVQIFNIPAHLTAIKCLFPVPHSHHY